MCRDCVVNWLGTNKDIFRVHQTKIWSLKSVNSPLEINHHSCKTAPILTTFTHNTSLESLNKHTCCVLQRICRTHQNKCGVFPFSTTLPELLKPKEHNTSNTMYSSMFYHMFRPFVSAIMADHKRPKHGRHKRPKYVVEQMNVRCF